MQNQLHVGGMGMDGMFKLMVTNLPYLVQQPRVQRLFADIGRCRVSIKKYIPLPTP